MPKINENITLYGNMCNFGSGQAKDTEFLRYCNKLQIIQQDTKMGFVRDNIGEYWLIQINSNQNTDRVISIPNFIVGLMQPIHIKNKNTGYRKRFDDSHWGIENCIDKFSGIHSFIEFSNPKKTLTIVGPNKPIIGKVSYLFNYLQAKELRFKQFDIQKIEDLDSMFSGQEIEHLDLSGIKFGKVQGMARMFEHTYIGGKLNLSMLDIQECESFKECFSYTFGLTDVILPKARIYKPVVIDRMFNNCKSLRNVNINDLHIQNVFQSREMFKRCNEIERIDLSNLNTTQEMFNLVINCRRLKSLVLSDKFKPLEYAIKVVISSKELEIQWV